MRASKEDLQFTRCILPDLYAIEAVLNEHGVLPDTEKAAILDSLEKDRHKGEEEEEEEEEELPF